MEDKLLTLEAKVQYLEAKRSEWVMEKAALETKVEAYILSEMKLRAENTSLKSKVKELEGGGQASPSSMSPSPLISSHLLPSPPSMPPGFSSIFSNSNNPPPHLDALDMKLPDYTSLLASSSQYPRATTSLEALEVMISSPSSYSSSSHPLSSGPRGGPNSSSGGGGGQQQQQQQYQYQYSGGTPTPTPSAPTPTPPPTTTTPTPPPPFSSSSSTPTPPLEEPINWGPRILGTLARWRDSNPGATAANVDGATAFTDEDCHYLAGLRAVRLSGCTGITDAGIAALCAPPCILEALDISGCVQRGLTNATLATLTRAAPSLRVLYMAGCRQEGISDAGLATLLRSPHCRLTSLQIAHCSQLSGGAFTAPSSSHSHSLPATLTAIDSFGCAPSVSSALEASGLGMALTASHTPTPQHTLASTPCKNFGRSGGCKLSRCMFSHTGGAKAIYLDLAGPGLRAIAGDMKKHIKGWMEGRDDHVRFSYDPALHYITLAPILSDAHLDRGRAEATLGQLVAIVGEFFKREALPGRPYTPLRCLEEGEARARWRLITPDDAGWGRWAGAPPHARITASPRLGVELLGRHTAAQWWRHLPQPGGPSLAAVDTLCLESNQDQEVVWVSGVDGKGVEVCAEIIRMCVWRGEWGCLTGLKGILREYSWCPRVFGRGATTYPSSQHTSTAGTAGTTTTMPTRGARAAAASSSSSPRLPATLTACKYEASKSGCGNPSCRFMHVLPRPLRALRGKERKAAMAAAAGSRGGGGGGGFYEGGEEGEEEEEELWEEWVEDEEGEEGGGGEEAPKLVEAPVKKPTPLKGVVLGVGAQKYFSSFNPEDEDDDE